MKRKINLKKKVPEKFSSRDLLDYWYDNYLEINSVPYNHHSFIGNEMKKFKELLSDYDVYTVLLAINNGIKNGETSVEYFCNGVEEYIIRTKYAKYMYLVSRVGKKEQRDALNELLMLENKWFPTAIDRKRSDEIVYNLDGWLDVI